MRGRKNASFRTVTRFITGVLTLTVALLLLPFFAERAFAKENGVSLESTGTLLLYGHFTMEEVQAYAGNEDVIKVEAMDGAVFPENCQKLFRDFYYAEYFDLSMADTSNVRNMDRMFLNCKEAKRIEVQGFDTSNVKEMKYMFYLKRSHAIMDEEVA